MSNSRVLIMAGGTGGHIFPGLALAAELQARGVSVEWLGTRRGLESRLVRDAGIALHFIDIEGVRGRGPAALLKAPFLVLMAIIQAAKVIRQFNPAVIVGLGGFVAGPGGAAAKLLGKPLVIHEQNAIAGTTNKLLSRIADRVLSAFPNVFAKAEVIGNPVRREIAEISEPKTRFSASPDQLNVLVLGGSRGARAINQLMPEVLSKVFSLSATQCAAKISVLHQTGDALVDETLEAYNLHKIELGDQVQVTAFVDDMAAKLTWANLVICRSGALTVSELAAAGVASLLVPFPYAIDDHQTVNGQFLVGAGAAKMWQQSELSADTLAAQIIEFSEKPEALLQMAEHARAEAKPEATARFADVCQTFIVSELVGKV
ncbi:undecaprenyldiphospho-muramoylpentapeptide beta-N-acetylglucosaminyltransferase [Teredinibacter turnerae]|uniref:undecaprenyldiphospho-muramoylpentapeptide beta-N-acetylglucosaminyltransferase n=1 Tax=Teredinibacter turnerae TaxID=2426 RepID=UPI0022A850C5|nr:undecaprenyldiphospho-muramoylpentapeptide beta-N-acetylglucosaminyltransferase [Teredinibacter turnerae]